MELSGKSPSYLAALELAERLPRVEQLELAEALREPRPHGLQPPAPGKTSSVYVHEIAELLMHLQAKSAYVFVVDGIKGTGGCPLVALQPTREAHAAAHRELLEYMRRSVKLFEADIERLGL